MISPSEPLSVSAASALAKNALEGIRVRIIGEVSQVNAKAGYKAVYFSVKDSSATLSCMIWNNRYAACGVQLRVGMLVEMAGRFSLYQAKGTMSFEAQSISVAGEGILRQQVAQLAERLKAEGLMDPSQKRPIPQFPLSVGLVTSPRGAAVHDVLRTLRRRFPCARVSVAGVPVEGVGAARGMASAIEFMSQQDVEVILLVRGGGSYEDLMPFNDEVLARAVRRSKVPVVTGIGHEPDNSIADMVADKRCSTPTAAAEAVSPDKAELLATLNGFSSRMTGTITSRLSSSQRYLESIGRRPVLEHPEQILGQASMRLDDLHARIDRSLPALFDSQSSRLDEANRRLLLGCQGFSVRESAMLDHGSMALQRIGRTFTNEHRQSVGALAGKLDALSPLAVLARGYGYVEDDKQHVVSSVGQAQVGERITVHMRDGYMDATIDRITERNEEDDR